MDGFSTGLDHAPLTSNATHTHIHARTHARGPSAIKSLRQRGRSSSFLSFFLSCFCLSAWFLAVFSFLYLCLLPFFDSLRAFVFFGPSSVHFFFQLSCRASFVLSRCLVLSHKALSPPVVHKRTRLHSCVKPTPPGGSRSRAPTVLSSALPARGQRPRFSEFSPV